MVRRRGRPARRTTAVLVLFLFAALIALCAAGTSDSGHTARVHPIAHAVKDASKVLTASGVRVGADDGGWPAAGTVAAIAFAALVLAALRLGRRELGGEQCDTVAGPSRGPPCRPVLA